MLVHSVPTAGTAVATLSTADLGSDTTPVALMFVSGAVVHPGLYRLSQAARVADAIAAAGGMTSAADPGKLPNLAARVQDARQINVPFLKPSGSSGSATVRLDVNSASMEELAAVPGMPAGLAQAIVDYRSTWGSVASLTELRDALEVDKATYAAISPWLRAIH